MFVNIFRKFPKIAIFACIFLHHVSFAGCVQFKYFRDNGDSTVTDLRSKLIWQKCLVGQEWDGKRCIGASSKFDWWAAVELAQASRLQGTKDWRLPTRSEMKTLIAKNCKDKSLEYLFEVKEYDIWVWTSSEYKERNSDLTPVWHFSQEVETGKFEDGVGLWTVYKDDRNNRVRLVRNIGLSINPSNGLMNLSRDKEKELAKFNKELRKYDTSNESQIRKGDFTNLSGPNWDGKIETWTALCKSGGGASVIIDHGSNSQVYGFTGFGFENATGGTTVGTGVDYAMQKGCIGKIR